MSGGSLASRHNLPAEIASFIGREAELTEVTRLLHRTRLLTLTGVGGCGKTRLALRTAAGLLQTFPDGVWLVPLAPLADSSLLPRTIATAVGIRGTTGRPLMAALISALAGRRLLLVLDNCEHLIGACARVAETILGACPQLRILATSREPLRVNGETVWRVPPLAAPDLAPAPLETLATVESVALFLDRARARRPDFRLTAQNAPAVAAICRRLEGLPLAIELAAAQVGALPPGQIASLLDDALSVLSGGSRTAPRQETLRAALDWSHALLGEGEQILLRRLAVFAGSFGVEAVEGVCPGGGIGPPHVLPLLTALIEKSLVEPWAAGDEARFRLLEPVRQYACVHLGHIIANRATMQPGFHWTKHVKPVVGTDLCQIRHTGYVVSGRSAVRMADGTERELSAGDVFDVPPGHDMWVVGNEPYVSVDFNLTDEAATPLK